jgi:hypothetical protein
MKSVDFRNQQLSDKMIVRNIERQNLTKKQYLLAQITSYL